MKTLIMLSTVIAVFTVWMTGGAASAYTIAVFKGVDNGDGQYAYDESYKGSLSAVKVETFDTRDTEGNYLPMLSWSDSADAWYSIRNSGNEYCRPPGYVRTMGDFPWSDETFYLAIYAGSRTVDLGKDYTYLGFWLGSPESFNSVTLSRTGGTVLTLSGDQLSDSDAFVSITDITFDAVTFATNDYSFEIDNITVGDASEVPIPGTLVLFVTGLIGMSLSVPVFKGKG